MTVARRSLREEINQATHRDMACHVRRVTLPGADMASHVCPYINRVGCRTSIHNPSPNSVQPILISITCAVRLRAVVGSRAALRADSRQLPAKTSPIAAPINTSCSNTTASNKRHKRGREQGRFIEERLAFTYSLARRVERQVELQHVDARFAQHAQRAALGVPRD